MDRTVRRETDAVDCGHHDRIGSQYDEQDAAETSKEETGRTSPRLEVNITMDIEEKNELSLLGRIGGRKFGAVLIVGIILLATILLAAFLIPDNPLIWEAVKGLTTALVVISIGFYGGNVGEKYINKIKGKSV